MENRRIFKGEIRSKYREGGKNWAAICRSKSGKYMDRQFLDYEKFPHLYDFSIVSKGDVIELAYDEYVGGRHPNGFRSNDTAHNREYFVVLAISDSEVVVTGGYPEYLSAYKYRQSEDFDRKTLEIY